MWQRMQPKSRITVLLSAELEPKITVPILIDAQ